MNISYNIPAEKIKIFVVVVVNEATGKIILKRPFVDFNKASRFYDDADMWYGDTHEIRLNTVIK